MSRRARTWALPALLLAAWGCGEESAAPRLAGGAAGWNVLLLTVDTVRADRLGAWGYEVRDTSPRIDQLAAQGVRFDRAMAHRATTWPSLGSVLTGLYPSGHGVVTNGYGFPDDLATLPKLLGAAGYRTGAFVSNMCRANHQGWDKFYCSKGRDGRVTTQALEWLDESADERPLLLWTHYFGAHPPYFNGGKRVEQLDPGYEGPVVANKNTLSRLMNQRVELGERDLAHLDAIYDAAVMGTDRILGKLLDGLAERGLLERTVIVFLADHGEDLWDHHGYAYHACSVYQTGLHVPLAVVAPGLVAAGGSVAPAVELADVTPTLLEMLGLEAPGPLHGRSLVPYLERPEATSGKPAFSEYGDTRIHTVVAGDWKLIVNPDEVAPLCYEGAPPDLYPLEAVELYNLADDPAETRNLAAEMPDKVKELEAMIAERFAQLTSRKEQQEIPEDLKAELRALGYVAN